MNKKYTMPDLNMDIEAFRSEIQRDYKALCKRYSLPPKFNFNAIVSAVKEGGRGMDEKSSYARIRDEIINLIAGSTEDSEGINDALEVLTGIWNYFPHDDLGGLAPAEKMAESMQSNPVFSPSIFNGEDMDSYWTLLDKEVLAFSDVAGNKLYEYIKELGGDKKDMKNIINVLSDPEEDPANALLYLIKRLPDLAKIKNKRITMDVVQPAVRALMRYENYISSEMPNGHHNSRMLHYVIEQVMERNEINLKEAKKQKGASGMTAGVLDPLTAFQSLAMVHDAINDFCFDLDADIGIEEAAIHLTDWLAMTDIFDLLAKTDLNETAFYLVGAARFIAETGNPKKPYKLLNNKLRELLKDYGSDDGLYHSEVARLAEKAICSSADPIMMMPYPGKEPNDCMERLMTIAPCLKFRPISNSFDY